MAGLYIHIPFCRQACHYCDFHFSTSSKHFEEMISALQKEIVIRKEYLNREKIETIYFGGGTPSLISAEILNSVFETIYNVHSVSEDTEVTLEANPDDLTKEYLQLLKQTPVNRLSIGIQSFHERDLMMMNRAHNATQALQCVPDAAMAGFNNISIDLIYGIQGMSFTEWLQNVDTALSLPVNHLSCYCLTVEPKTALAKQIQSGKISSVNDDDAVSQFEILLEKTESAGIPWYEVSNFAKPGFESRHNTSYWKGISYLGIGPSAHSFKGESRQWNVRNNSQYILAINKGEIPAETEILTAEQRFNETVLTSLRTRKGLTAMAVRNSGWPGAWKEITEQSNSKIADGLIMLNDETLSLTRKGLLFADAIAADYFKL